MNRVLSKVGPLALCLVVSAPFFLLVGGAPQQNGPRQEANPPPGAKATTQEPPQKSPQETPEKPPEKPPEKRQKPGERDKMRRDYDKDCSRSGCHAEILTVPWVHGPVAVGACDACHVPAPKEGEHKFTYRRAKEKMCTFCHVVVPREGVVHAPYSEGDCSSCHGVHGGHKTALLKAPTISGLCESCHNGQEYPKTGKVLRSIRDEILAGEFKHGPVKEGDCSACHRSHASPHSRLLIGEYPEGFYTEYGEKTYDFCFQCHDRRLASAQETSVTGFRDGFRNLHYVHVNQKKSRTCLVCHNVHAGSNRLLLRDSVPFGSGGWRLPIGFKPRPDGGSCTTGCHRAMTYQRSVADVEPSTEKK